MSTGKYSKGYKKKPGSTPTPPPEPSRQSGGTSGDLSIPGYKPKTPTVAYSPASSTSSAASSSAPTGPARGAAAAAQHAAVRQQRLVDTYVTKAYAKKLEKKGVPSLEVGVRVERAKSQLEKDRERLLSHPAVEKANEEGRVVSVKSIQKLDKRTKRSEALADPKRQQQGIRQTLGPFTPDRRSSSGTRTLTAKGPTSGDSWSPGDPLALAVEKDVIAPLQREGKLPERPTTGQQIYQKVAEYGPLAISMAPEIAAGAKALNLGLRGAEVGGERIAGNALSKVLKPVAADSPAARATVAASRADAEAVTSGVRRLAQVATKGSRSRSLARAVTETPTRKEVARAGGLPLLGMKAGTPTGSSILEGTGQAFSTPQNAKETLITTGRALPAAITAPAALLYSAGRIPFDGTKPLEETASGQLEGLGQIGANLLSGDPDKVQKAVEQEGALSLLTPLPALTRTRAYKAVRRDVREVAAGARRLSGHGRRAPTEQNVFGFTERREGRKRVGKAHARSTNPHRVSEARHTNAILHGSTTRPALSSAPEGSHVTLQTLLEYGIRNPEGVKLVRERGPKTEPSVEGKVNLDAALRYAEEHPEIFKDKAFTRALKAGERASKTTPAAVKGAGAVATHRAQGDLFGIVPPDKATPMKAREFTSAKDREGAWRHLTEMEARITELRNRRRGSGPKGKQEGRRAAELEALEKRAKGLRAALDPFTRPDAKSLSGERMAWDKALEKEYLTKVTAAVEKSPLTWPVWTHHATFRNSKLGIEKGTLPATAGSTPKVRKGSLAQHDLVDRSLEAFVRGTVQMPRRRAGAAKFARDVAHAEKIPYTVDGKAKFIVPDSETWAKITGPKTKENPNGGQIDTKTYGRFPLRQWKTAVKDPFTEDARLEGILRDAEEGRIQGHEPSLILPREVIREFNATLNPDHAPLTEAMGKLSTGASRLILNTNPAWAAAQIPAEGIPLLLAHPELLNPVKTGSILKDLHQFRRDHPEEAAMIEGSAGASPVITAGSLRSPLDLERESSFNPQPAMFAKGAKAMTRGRIGRAMISTAKLEPLSLFDVKRQNAYRSVLLAAEADKQFRGFTSGVRNHFRKSAKLSEKFKGKSREDLWTWLTTTKEGKAQLQKLSDYVDEIQGNWTAFTRYEKAFAPLTIFYPFLRYSLRWTLWTFPKTHPVTATIAYMLGQANANELENLLGAKPASPLLYSYPVIKDGEGKADVLPGGSRISPGQSALQQAAASQEAPQLLSALNPILGAGLTAVGGPGPFGQKPSGPAGWAAIDQLLSLPAPLRILMNETGVHSEEAAAALGLARKHPESVIAKAFKKLDPGKSARSLLFPALPQSGRNARLSNQLSRALKEAEANSKSKREEVAGDDSLTVKERQKKIAQMEARSDKAGEAIDGVLKKLGLDKEDEESYERFKAAMYEGKDEGSEGIYGGGESIYDGGKSIYEGGSIYGEDKNSKALEYKPPSGAIHIPGFSGITGAIGSLIGGTPARAAELSKYGRPTKASRHSLDFLGKKTVGNPTRAELIKDGAAGKLTVNHKGKILTPAVRKASKELRAAYSMVKPQIEGFSDPDQQEFAEWFSHYSKLPPKLAGEWVKQEGGGYGSTGVSGGEAGEQNWLGVGYPGHRTPMAESPYFNGVSPKQAAKNTALWMEGKIGHEYAYRAAPSIQVIAKLAKEGAPEARIRAYIEGPSAWGTGAISQSGIVVKGPQGGAAKALKIAKRNAKAAGLNPTAFNGDVERGSGKTVTVRADAKGMVNWATSAVGVKEGTAKQQRWADLTGLGYSEPWCADFIAAGLERRGVPLPSNPNHTAYYADPNWSGGTQIGTDMRKAKPGDLLAFGANEHIGLYVGNGEMIAGNWGDEVARYKVSDDSRGVTAIVRPHYRGGKIQIRESAVLPGSTAEATFASSPSGVAAVPNFEGTSTAATAGTKRNGKTETVQGLTPGQKLAQVNAILEGDLSKFGIPSSPKAPTVSDLASLGRSLEAGRKELLRL